jgi:D-alanyl-D-alanine carboxypeptidase
MRRVLVAAVVLVALPTLVLVGWTASRGPDEPELGALLDRVVAAGAPGAFVVIRDSDEVRREASGLADVRHGRSMDPDDRFRVGSVTKTFVAALVLRLVEDGRLGLDDSVERWLPGLVPDGRAITVRHLLSNTSGLFDYVSDPRVLRQSRRRWTPRELVEIAVGHFPEHVPSGSAYAYSSTNYVLLGLIAERAGGASLGRQLREQVFVPLGLRETSLVDGVVRGRHVHGHRPPSHQGVVTGRPADVSDEPAWWAWAAGGIVSTADDVQRFFRELLQGRFLGPRALREMRTLLPAGRIQYGLGILAAPTSCGPAWGHSGNAQGTITLAWNTEDASRQLVLVVNTYPLSAELEAAVRELQQAAFCGVS